MGIDLDHRRGVVTGAGSGIGCEMALRLAARGAELVLVGRRRQTLQRTADLMRDAGGTAHVAVADLTEPGTPARIARRAQDVFGDYDLLINNAGNVRAGSLREHSAEDIQAMIAHNLTAPVLLSRAALPALRPPTPEKQALLLNIASGIALVNLPFYTVYSATKSGLAAFGHALRRELHSTPVHVATAYPGATDTDMMATSRAGDELGFGRREVTDVVRDIFAALEQGRHEINTALPARRALQDLHRRDPLAVDAQLAPKLREMENAVRGHRSI
ncbi:SDR family NAD(P)-dependent oxidoreductase [Streptomyces sp. RLB1-33]|nr:SDR family NAD(P)-dependent oxidoreductase [Streptomyces sp. RLB1-33]QIY75932.1 SDR family NAD(P)-dependent oxidoreductase [Streptomyces sp. RLB1-33]